MFKNKTLIIAVLVLAVLLVGAGAYLKLSKSANVTPKVAQEQPKSSPSNPVENLKSLLSGGRTVNCTINNPDKSGTVFISDKKFRGDFVTKDSNGKTVDSHVISDGTYTYIWSSSSPSGIKMKVDITSAEASAQAKNFNLDEQAGLNCSPWGVDASKFAVPTNVQFTDFTQMMNQAQPKATTGTQTQGSSPCDQISDPSAKAACVNALKNSNSGY